MKQSSAIFQNRFDLDRKKSNNEKNVPNQIKSRRLFIHVIDNSHICPIEKLMKRKVFHSTNLIDIKYIIHHLNLKTHTNRHIVKDYESDLFFCFFLPFGKEDLFGRKKASLIEGEI